MYPDILNYDKVVEVTGSFKTPMGCRSFLGTHEENNELVHDGRNNLGVVSLNLPRIALESDGDEGKYNYWICVWRWLKKPGYAYSTLIRG